LQLLMKNVFATGDQDKIQSLLSDYATLANDAKAVSKKIAADTKATQAEKDDAETELVLAQKRSRELQLAYKMEVDAYNEMVAAAAAAAQEALDAAKAVKLTQDEELELL
jgi:hypothetical protein